MGYDCVVTTSTSLSGMWVDISWEHEQSELKCVGFTLDSDYQFAVINAGRLTASNTEGRYYLSCPFSSDDDSAGWVSYIWRRTTTTEDEVEYDGSTIPIEAIAAKLAEHAEKIEEGILEWNRALRIPESADDDVTYNTFFPPKTVRAGQVMGFDSDGHVTVGVDNISELKSYIDDFIEEINSLISNADSNYSTILANIYAAAETATTAASSAEAAEEAAESAADRASGYAGTALSSATAAAESATAANTSAEEAKAYAAAAKTSAASAEEDATDSEYYSELARAYVAAVSGNFTTVIVEELPDEGEGLTFYYVGSDDDGYTVYIWDETNAKWVELTTTEFAGNTPATYSSYGLVKLGTETTLTESECAVVGVDKNGHMLVPLATREANSSGVTTTNEAGAVKLGSSYNPGHSMPYVVGIGLSSVDGGLAFDLEKNGPLVYTTNDDETTDSNVAYHMSVLDASDTQKGVVYLCSEMSGLTDDEMSTRAASVSLVNSSLEYYATQGAQTYLESSSGKETVESIIKDYSDDIYVAKGTSTSSTSVSAPASATTTSYAKALAIGVNAAVYSSQSVALGYGAYAGSLYRYAGTYRNTAVGYGAMAYGGNVFGSRCYAQFDSIAMGVGTYSFGLGNVAVGNGCVANGERSIVYGRYCYTDGMYAIAVGNHDTATAQGAVAVGTNCDVSGTNSVGVGRNADTSGTTAVSVGFNTTASGTSSAAIGYGATASADSAFAAGTGATASATYAVAIGGYNTKASGENSFAAGSASTASAGSAFAMGTSVTASASGAVAIGISTTASGAQSVAVGNNAKATTSSSVAIGASATETGGYSVCVGRSASVGGMYAVTVGDGSSANGKYSASFGYQASSSSNYSTSVGAYAESNAAYGVSIGNNAVIKSTANRSVVVGPGGTVYSPQTLFVAGPAGGIGIFSVDDTPYLFTTTSSTATSGYCVSLEDFNWLFGIFGLLNEFAVDTSSGEITLTEVDASSFTSS